MSHHHIMPPIIYTAPPKPKKIETRKRRINVGATDDMEETGETQQAAGFSQSAPTANKPPMQNFTPIEGSEQKPQHPRGRLSENTLKVMLEAQELK